MSEDDLDAKRNLPQEGRYWLVRRFAWTLALWNAAGEPPEITFDPGVEDVCDLWLGLRVVDPVMTFDIEFTGDKEFTQHIPARRGHIPSCHPPRHDEACLLP